MLLLTKLPTKTLHEPCKALTKDEILGAQTQKFIKEMIPAMYHYEGIGLAAPQVAKNLQICIIGKEADKSLKSDLILINPQYERLSKKTKIDSEGCLSVPGKMCTVKRYHNIHVTALGVDGQEFSFDAKGFFARVIQHEWDHLQGTLIVDRAKEVFDVENKQ